MACTYTRKFFFRFKDELVKSMACTSRVIEDKERCRTYKIKELGKEKLAKIVLIVSEGILKCSWQLYETKGIPCWHILFVLRLEGIEYSLDYLILGRWTTNVISNVVCDAREINLCSNKENMHPPRKTQILPTILEWLDIVCSSEYFEETREELVKIGDWLKEMTNRSVQPIQCSK